MNALTLEWATKAEADLATARRELEVRDDPNWDAVCFHSQRSAEKYLKARLFEAGVPFPRTHDLVALLQLVLPIEPLRSGLSEHLDVLTDQAVEVRYPGTSIDQTEAAEAVQTAELVRTHVRRSLGLTE